MFVPDTFDDHTSVRSYGFALPGKQFESLFLVANAVRNSCWGFMFEPL